MIMVYHKLGKCFIEIQVVVMVIVVRDGDDDPVP